MPTNVSRRAALTGLLVAGLGGSGRAAPAPPARPASRKELEDLWADLAGDEMTASRALLKLADRPAEAVALCGEKLKALTIDEKRVRALLADLGDEKEQTWKAAVEELEYFDPRLTIDLPTLMDAVIDRVARARLVAVLSGRTAVMLLQEKAPITLDRSVEKTGEVYYNFRQNGGRGGPSTGSTGSTSAFTGTSGSTGRGPCGRWYCWSTCTPRRQWPS